MMLKSAGLLLIAVALISVAKAQNKHGDPVVASYVQLYKSDKPDDRIQFEAGIKKLASSYNENEVRRALFVYEEIGRKESADSIVQVAIKRFPKGNTDMIYTHNKIRAFRGSGEQTAALYNKWKKDYPEPARDSLLLHDYAKIGIVENYLAETKVKEAVYWLGQLHDIDYTSNILLYKAQEIAEMGDSVAALQLFIQSAAMYQRLCAKDSTKKYLAQHYVSAATAAATLLYHAGRYPEALEYIKMAPVHKADLQYYPEYKIMLALVLAVNGKEVEAFPRMEKLLKSGEANERVKQAFPAVYAKAKGSAEGYKSYMAAVTLELRMRLAEKLAKEIVSEAAPAFTIKDIDGKTIQLADYKGKVVILDFWATWCTPCKRSFPAMKLTMEKYRQDTSVHFFFVDCWEMEKEPEPLIRRYLARNNYAFHVLMDTQKRDTGVAKDFDVKGIPAKFVIDGKGKIRFKMKGFDGADDKAVEELSIMIDMAKE